MRIIYNNRIDLVGLHDSWRGKPMCQGTKQLETVKNWQPNTEEMADNARYIGRRLYLPCLLMLTAIIQNVVLQTSTHAHVSTNLWSRHLVSIDKVRWLFYSHWQTHKHVRTVWLWPLAFWFQSQMQIRMPEYYHV